MAYWGGDGSLPFKSSRIPQLSRKHSPPFWCSHMLSPGRHESKQKHGSNMQVAMLTDSRTLSTSSGSTGLNSFQITMLEHASLNSLGSAHPESSSEQIWVTLSDWCLELLHSSNIDVPPANSFEELPNHFKQGHQIILYTYNKNRRLTMICHFYLYKVTLKKGSYPRSIRFAFQHSRHVFIAQSYSKNQGFMDRKSLHRDNSIQGHYHSLIPAVAKTLIKLCIITIRQLGRPIK